MRSARQATMYDPETRKFTLINLCFSTQHLMFAEDADNTLWFSNPGRRRDRLAQHEEV